MSLLHAGRPWPAVEGGGPVSLGAVSPSQPFQPPGDILCSLPAGAGGPQADVGVPEFPFTFRSAYDVFREFFGGRDPFAEFFGECWGAPSLPGPAGLVLLCAAGCPALWSRPRPQGPAAPMPRAHAALAAFQMTCCPSRRCGAPAPAPRGQDTSSPPSRHPQVGPSWGRPPSAVPSPASPSIPAPCTPR